MTDLTTVSAAITAATSAVALIDAIWDQVDCFLTGRHFQGTPAKNRAGR